MKIKRGDEQKLSDQVKTHVNKEVMEEEKDYEGNVETMISTGSTLLDLEISGGRVRGGGIPGGILVEIFGPSGSGKTVMLCEIAGDVQRKGGQVMFRDPEARLNRNFARLFDLEPNEIDYEQPDTVPQLFGPIRKWEPEPEDKIHGIFGDSLAALSTNLELTKEDGDKYGMRRAKEFSEECRKTCRILTNKNFLMVCSNQVRQNSDATNPFAEKTTTPGGMAIPYYASLRLKCFSPQKEKKKKTIQGKEVSKVIGVTTRVEVYKSSVWKPYGVAPITIIFDYGIDDIRQNLQFLKDYTKTSVYQIGEEKLDKSLEKSIEMVEQGNKELDLKNEVIDLWEDIQSKFKSNRKGKERNVT